MVSLERARRITAELWGSRAAAKIASEDWKRYHWHSHPITLRLINHRISGNPDEDWLAFFRRRFVPSTVDRALSLGAGHGFAEREMLSLGICRQIDAFDLAPEAIEAARAASRKAGLQKQISYHVADLNSAELPRNTYDICIAASILHHVENLEHLLTQIENALLPGGLVLVQEYIGPDRFQFPDEQIKLMNDLLTVLPDSFRRMPDGSVKSHTGRPSLEEIMQVDPSEAIRSSAIPKFIEQQFDVLYRIDYGGTLLHFALADIIANFNESSPEHQAIAGMLVHHEETLIRCGILKSDFTYIVAAKRA